jgi:hypothetical protein
VTIDNPRENVWISVKSGFPPEESDNDFTCDVWSTLKLRDRTVSRRSIDCYYDAGKWYEDSGDEVQGEVEYWMLSVGPSVKGEFSSLDRVSNDYPCPFCKAQNDVYVYGCNGVGTFHDRYYVSCCACHAKSPIEYESYTALKKWVKVAKRNNNYKKAHWLESS